MREKGIQQHSSDITTVIFHLLLHFTARVADLAQFKGALTFCAKANSPFLKGPNHTLVVLLHTQVPTYNDIKVVQTQFLFLIMNFCP